MAKRILYTPLAWVSAGGVTRTYTTEVRFPPTEAVATAQLTSVAGDGWVKIGIVAATFLPEGSKREKRVEFLGRPEDWRPSFAADRLTSVTFALWLHSRGGLAAASAQGLVFLHGSSGKALKDGSDPSVPLEAERRALVYDPKTGIVQHSFGLVAIGGAKQPAEKDVDATAQALVQSMGDRDRSAVLSVPKSALERSMLYRVDPRTRTLQRMSVTRKPVESRAPRPATAPAAKAAPSAKAAAATKAAAAARAAVIRAAAAAKAGAARKPRAASTTTRTAARPTTRLGMRPATRLGTRPATKLATKPAMKPATKLATKPSTKLAIKPATKLATKPGAKLATKPAPKPAPKPAIKPATKPAAKSKPKKR